MTPDIVSTVLGAAPQLGGGGFLVVVLVLLLRREASSAERWATERAALIAEHDAEVADLRVQLDAALARIDAERRARWDVEDQRYQPSTRPAGGRRRRAEGDQ